MNTGNIPITKELVLLGGGHSHVEVLRTFAVKPEPGLQLTLVTKDMHTPYSGMLPGLLAGHYEFDEAHIDLRPLARLAGARIVNAPVTGLDPGARCLELRDRPAIHYDILSINTGSTPRLSGVPGAVEHAVPVKPINRFLEQWQSLRQRLKVRDDKARPFLILVVGGGAGGVELLLSLREALQKELGDDAKSIEFTLVTSGEDILPTHAAGVRHRYRSILAARDVCVSAGKGKQVNRIQGREAHCVDGSFFGFDALFWVTDAAAPDWIRESGLAVDNAGFIAVDPFLRSTSHADVFAAGDCASMLSSPRPKSGVFAVRQGPPLADNLRAAARSEPLDEYIPQNRFLSLISTGDKNAVASYGPFAAQGKWVWRWKDRIDRAFMEKYADVKAILQMRAGMQPEIIQPEFRCGGCGAKVGGDVLRNVLDRLGVEAGDDAAILPTGRGGIPLQTVDFFREFVGDPYLFGRIAAHHAINDIVAMGGGVGSALATVVVPHGKEAFVEGTLMQILTGVIEVLAEHGATLIGGHSAEGAELAVGLTVNGEVSGGAAWSKQGLQPGDQLLLTKPLGTGVLFAADMQGRAQGRWIAAALECMDQSNAKAAAIFRELGISACTDITGFGLLGHLREMLGDARSAEVRLESLPLLAGVKQLMDGGIASTMAPKNAGFGAQCSIDGETSEVVFDPQTAGGLLAGIAKDMAEECRSRLVEAGYEDAAVIGEVRVRHGDAICLTAH